MSLGRAMLVDGGPFAAVVGQFRADCFNISLQSEVRPIYSAIFEERPEVFHEGAVF